MFLFYCAQKAYLHFEGWLFCCLWWSQKALGPIKTIITSEDEQVVGLCNNSKVNYDRFFCGEGPFIRLKRLTSILILPIMPDKTNHIKIIIDKLYCIENCAFILGKVNSLAGAPR